MTSIILQGEITPDGKLHVDLPSSVPAGPVEVEIRPVEIEGVTLGEMLNSGLVGLWAGRTDIEDSVEFARTLRRRASRRAIE